MKTAPKPILILLELLLLITILTGCDSKSEVTPTGYIDPNSTQAPSITPSPTATATVTPQPLALSVNGEGVLLSEYSASLTQLQAADATAGNQRSPEDQRQMVLEDLIGQTLLAQAAFEDGFQISPEGLQAKIDALETQLGGKEALDAWMSQNGYDESSFKVALLRATAAAWQRDAIIASVPDFAEQVKASQILTRQRETAERYLSRLRAGEDFVTLAFIVDPLTGGELGWFPRGYLLQPAVEEIAFNLQPGEYSEIIETEIGFHIIFVSERSTNQPLSRDALLTLQRLAVGQWVDAARQIADVQVLLP
jgi:peptidyl-prolyl cis-trans isomerase C